MAQRKIITENGHQYEVVTNDEGREIERVACDVIPAINRGPSPEVTALLGKDPQTFTIKDLAILLQHLAQRQ